MSYLHGYTNEEAQRLYRQAHILGPAIYENLRFDSLENLLEVGCGSGSQTHYLIQKYPLLKLTSLDREAFQIQKLKERLHQHKNLKLIQGNACSLPFDHESFDGVFFCWALEHIPEIRTALNEALRVCKKGGRIYINEVSNHTFFTSPSCPAIEHYWNRYNEMQLQFGGHPFLGEHLAYLMAPLPCQILDDRMITITAKGGSPGSHDDDIILYWEELMLSAQNQLFEVGLLTSHVVKKMREDFNFLRKNPSSTLSFSWKQIQAIKI